MNLFQEFLNKTDYSILYKASKMEVEQLKR